MKKEKRGGAREGAGRKPTSILIAVTYRVDPEVVGGIAILAKRWNVSKAQAVQRAVLDSV